MTLFYCTRFLRAQREENLLLYYTLFCVESFVVPFFCARSEEQFYFIVPLFAQTTFFCFRFLRAQREENLEEKCRGSGFSGNLKNL